MNYILLVDNTWEWFDGLSEAMIAYEKAVMQQKPVVLTKVLATNNIP